MPTCTQLRGVTLTDEDFIVRAEIEGTVDESPVLLNTDGSVPSSGAIDTYNSRNRITIEGKGELPAAFEAGALDFAAVGHTAGVTLITSTEEVQETGAHHSFTVEALNAPHAVPAVDETP